MMYNMDFLTEARVLLPRPSWQLTTIGVFEESFLTTTSMSSLKSEKSGGFSAVMGIRMWSSSKPSAAVWRDAMTSLRTATSSLQTSSQIGITEPSAVSVWSSSLEIQNQV